MTRKRPDLVGDYNIKLPPKYATRKICCCTYEFKVNQRFVYFSVPFGLLLLWFLRAVPSKPKTEMDIATWTPPQMRNHMEDVSLPAKESSIPSIQGTTSQPTLPPPQTTNCTPKSLDLEYEDFTNTTTFENLELECANSSHRFKLSQFVSLVTEISVKNTDFLPFGPYLVNFRGLRILTVQNGGISTVSNKSFAYIPVSLEVLSITDVISGIESNSFGRLTNLTSLVLSNGRIADIANRTFAGLAELTNLNLTGNGIRTIDQRSFEGLLKLERLTLRFNNISSVGSHAFALQSLQSIDLSHNRLEMVPKLVFHNLSKLEMLDLSFNVIVTLSDRSFATLPKLQVLNLNDNHIRMVKGVFTGLNVRTLSLRNNNITVLGSRSFEAFNVGVLDLGGNNITLNAVDAFSKVTIGEIMT